MLVLGMATASRPLWYLGRPLVGGDLTPIVPICCAALPLEPPHLVGQSDCLLVDCLQSNIHLLVL